MTQRRIRKVVFPVAGRGTRFLPATKATAKEMLPVVDKPLIQYAADEAVAAGADTLIFIVGRDKNAIADHFDSARELESDLEAAGKHALLAAVQGVLPKGVHCVYVRQPTPRGLGDAVLRARAAVDDEPFGVILPDDLIDAESPGTLARMFELHEETGAGVVAVETVRPEHTNRYGIVSIDELDERTGKLKSILEKPDPADAPSNLAVVGRYVLPPAVFNRLEQLGPGAGGEIQLTDAIAGLLDEHEMLAYRFPGRRFDCGSKLGYVEATVQYALKHPDLKDDYAAFIRSVAESL